MIDGTKILITNNRERITIALDSLKQSKFRSRFTLGTKDIDYIRVKGLDTIRNHAIDFITDRIAPRNPKNDGRQTPMKNHPVFIAQHATATCCRGCMQKWHKIPEGKALNDTEIKFIVDLIIEWIDRQIKQ